MLKIITDSASDLTEEVIRRYQLHVIPTPVVIDEVDYLDGQTIHSREFYNILDDTSRDVFGLGLGIRFAEVGRSHVQVQAGELFLGQIADPQVDLCHITFPGQRDDLMDVPGIQYDRGQSADGSATEADTT